MTNQFTTAFTNVTVPRPDWTKPLTMTVAATDSSGNQSAFGPPVVVPPRRIDDLTPPGPPVALGANLSGLDVVVSWLPAQAENDLAGYLIYYDERQGEPYPGQAAQQGDSPIQVGPEAMQLTLQGLPAGRPLYAVVTAIDESSNEGPPSAEMVVRVTDGIDGDGLPDDFERAYWGDTSNVDSSSDSDGDGLSAAEEYQLFTLPLDADTDGDGALDGDEQASSGTDPLDSFDQPAVAIIPQTLPDGQIDETYTAQLQVDGGAEPYTWRLTQGQLPDGLTLGNDGQISGTPTENGFFTLTAQVEDNDSQFDSQRFSLLIEGSPESGPDSSTYLPIIVRDHR